MADMGINISVGKMRSLSKRTKMMIAGGALLIVIVAVILAVVLSARGYYAKTMRLLRIEGTVSVEDENGVERSITENMRFQSGEAINTGAASLASIGLDDHKIVTLQENSRAEFRKQGKSLELMLTAGGVFFEVNKPLEDDESFDIRTSTMIVGIRGTSGYVFVDEEGHECLMLTDGHVHIKGTNPVTGEEKEIDVSAGNMVRVYLYNDREVDSIMFTEERIPETGIPDFARQMVLEDADLLAKVCEDAGWDPALIAAIEDGTFVIEITDDDLQSPEATATPTPTSTVRPTATATPTAMPEPDEDATATPTRTPPANVAGGTEGTTPAPQEPQGETEEPSEEVPTTTPTSGATVAPTRRVTPTAEPTETPAAVTVPTITPIVTVTPAPDADTAEAEPTPTEAPDNTAAPATDATETPAPEEPTDTPVPTTKVDPVVTDEPDPTEEPTPTDDPVYVMIETDDDDVVDVHLEIPDQDDVIRVIVTLAPEPDPDLPAVAEEQGYTKIVWDNYDAIFIIQVHQGAMGVYYGYTAVDTWSVLSRVEEEIDGVMYVSYYFTNSAGDNVRMYRESLG